MNISECHNCGSIWHPGTEEHDWQQCSACGWRPGDPVVDEDDDDDDDDDFGFYPDDPGACDDPNDSRNL